MSDNVCRRAAYVQLSAGNIKKSLCDKKSEIILFNMYTYKKKKSTHGKQTDGKAIGQYS